MQKVLFIDRDGTIIVEPLPSKQIDSFEKLQFLPSAISTLGRIKREAKNFEFVMVTNQDGLGTDSFPEDTFWPAHNKMLDILESEGFKFDTTFIDRSFEHENKPTRKPGTAMLQDYVHGNYDLANSYVIGDRLTDVKLAQNMGCKAILLGTKEDFNDPNLLAYCDLITTDWNDIYLHICCPPRRAIVHRATKETDILIELNLDGSGITQINTGLGFFDHMLDQLGKHSGADLKIVVKGDLHIDEHHTIEDTALALGEAYLKALGDKKGIDRYGFLLPMDEALAQVAIDFSGRNWLVWDADFKREKIGDMPTEMFYHFFKSFTDTSKSNLNIKVSGDNEHHKIEAIFKGLAKAIKMAVRRDSNNHQIPSTKGIL